MSQVSGIKLKMCPLHTGHPNREYRSCDEGTCAWWDGEMCAVARIARWYREVEDDVRRMNGGSGYDWDCSSANNWDNDNAMYAINPDVSNR